MGHNALKQEWKRPPTIYRVTPTTKTKDKKMAANYFLKKENVAEGGPDYAF